MLLTRILAHSDFLEESLAQLQAEREQYLDPFEEAMELVQSVVGIEEIAAASIIAEIGTDMTRFASDKHIASWAGVCPGNKQSGGKRLSGKTRHQAIRTSERSCARWPGPSPTPKTIICRRSHTAWLADMASKKRSWHSPIKSWSLSITSYVPRNLILTWELITLTNGIGNGSNVTLFTASNNSAIQ